MSARDGDRAGFTLVELLIVTVLGALILLSLYEVLNVNQRTYSAQSASARVQQTLRAGASVLYGELREVSPALGDIVQMGDNRIEVRANRSVGHVCQTPVSATSTPTLMVRRAGEWFEDGDSVTVFTDNNPRTESDDTWQTGQIRSLDITGLTCPGTTDEGQNMAVAGVDYGPPPDSILVGGPVRSFVHYSYYLDQVSGETFLVRAGPSNTEPMVGPVDPDDGVTFEYLDASGSTTTNPSQVNEIVVTLRSTSPVEDSQGNPVADSLEVRIYPRN